MGGAEGLTKKERLGLEREQAKLQAVARRHPRDGRRPRHALRHRHQQGGPGDRRGQEARHPGVAVLDSNCRPDGVDYPIPGNDDAARAIALYCDLIARAAIDGMAAQIGAAGVDIGGLEEAPVEEAVARRGRSGRAAMPPTPRRAEPR